MLNKLNLKLIGAAFLLLALLILGSSNLSAKPTKRAFGMLPALSQAKGMGGDAALPQSSNNAMGVPERTQSGDGFGGSGVIYPSRPFKATYTLSTELPELLDELYVYRSPEVGADSRVSSFLARITGLDIANRSGGQVQNISMFWPDQKLSVNYDQSGRFSVWRQDQKNYVEGGLGELPPDEEIIAVAESFLSELGIDKEKYGKPYVNKYWGDEFTKIRAPHPYVLDVAYPLNLDDLKVVSWGGYEEPGLSVNVDLSDRRGMGANGIVNRDGEKSLYPTEDRKVLEEQALKGGLNPIWGYGYGGDDVVYLKEKNDDVFEAAVDFNEAELAYLNHYYYDQQLQIGRNYYIPVLVLRGVYKDESGEERKHSTLVPVIKSNFFEGYGEVKPMPEPLPKLVPEPPVAEEKN